MGRVLVATIAGLDDIEPLSWMDYPVWATHLTLMTSEYRKPHDLTPVARKAILAMVRTLQGVPHEDQLNVIAYVARVWTDYISKEVKKLKT